MFNQKIKITITKILLVVMWGILGYYIIKALYLWIRKRRNTTTPISLGFVLSVSFLITFFPWWLLIFGII